MSYGQITCEVSVFDQNPLLTGLGRDNSNITVTRRKKYPLAAWENLRLVI
jgi:hypothetical protein